MTTRRTLLLLTFLVFGLASFKSSKQIRTGRAVETLDSTSDLGVNVYIDLDSIKYDTLVFPNGLGFISKILTTGIFHEDEVWEKASKEKWFGIFKNKNDTYLAKTKILTKRVKGIGDKENEKTGWQVETENSDTSILLIEGLKFLKGHKIQPVVLSKDIVSPGDTLQFNHLGIEYRIFATGGKEMVDNQWLGIWNYKLYLTASRDGQSVIELLVAQPNFDDQMIKILFAGDIDGDGFLDLIIDTSRHYNSRIPTLYLSKPAVRGHLVKPVGRHETVGC
jgi:hypothetical protein